MVGQGFDRDAIETAIQQAIATDQLDDAAFARLWMRDRMWHHPLSRAAISQELREKGIDPELIARTLAAEYPAVREVDLATTLAEERVRRMGSVPPDKRRNRLISFLARRGFSQNLVYQVVKSVEKDLDHVDD
jgi:regulatory protein